MFQYKNLTNHLQVVNTNADRTLYLEPRQTVDLAHGEEASSEIQSRIKGRRITGELIPVSVPEEKEPPETLVAPEPVLVVPEEKAEEEIVQPTKKVIRPKRRKKNKTKGE